MASPNNDQFDWTEFPLFAPDAAVVPRVADGDQNVPSALAALSHVLYDEETPREKAELLREKGNRAFKRGKRMYKEAIRLYNEAIEIGCDEPDVCAANFNNRAAAQLKLGNYGRALEDVEQSLKYEPENAKTFYRGAVAANSIGKHSRAIKYCRDGLAFADPGSAPHKPLLQELRRAESGLAKEEQRTKERDTREEAEQEAEANLVTLLQKRNVTMGAPLFAAQLKNEPNTPVVDEDGSLLWPVLFVYPDLRTGGQDDLANKSDFIAHFDEETSFNDHFAYMFPDDGPPLPWDPNHMYRASNLTVLYRRNWTYVAKDLEPSQSLEQMVGSQREVDDLGKWVSVTPETSLKEILGRADYVVPGFPVFYVCPRGYIPR